MALNTSDPVWLLKRTYSNESESCIYTKKLYLNRTDYEFNRYFSAGNKMYYTHYYAKLTNATGGEEGAQLNVSKKQSETSHGIPVVLLHWDDDSNCAILHYKDPKEDQYEKAKCEAYIWNESVENETSRQSCLEFYRLYCSEFNRTEQDVYQKGCMEHPGC
ncbi:uncharacterized protein LOC142584284 isoform X2 [Dermacentor variabilis]|uniref:uncharacterized protein LOC142584284 isoform X2 n=1 Tax=Dermacentor variabilis TaxID=34621 RepID=UPI003F5B5418